MSAPAEAVAAAHIAMLGRYLNKSNIERMLDAAAPHMLGADRAEVWAEGHEDGFWNGRMSSGETSDEALIGKEHADATNPYRPTP